SGDNVAPCLLEGCHHCRDISRIVLKIAIHRDNNLAARIIEPRGKRHSLPIVPFQPYCDDPRIIVSQSSQDASSGISTVIVDKYEFGWLVSPGHYRAQALVQLLNAVFFIVQRYYDRKLWPGWFFIKHRLISAPCTRLASLAGSCCCFSLRPMQLMARPALRPNNILGALLSSLLQLPVIDQLDASLIKRPPDARVRQPLELDFSGFFQAGAGLVKLAVMNSRVAHQLDGAAIQSLEQRYDCASIHQARQSYSIES